MLSIIIPTYNAAAYLPQLLDKLRIQTIAHELIVIDSESTDETRSIAQQAGVHFVSISKTSFNHGATRNLGAELAQHDVVLFMTQDALPVASDTLERLFLMLTSQDDIAMAYGRQIAYPETGVFGRLARLANYPAQSLLKTEVLIPEMGIKTCSCSNSFAAYRKADLKAVGGFPSGTILGEDVSVAARFILNGKTVAYCAEAEVFHSHDYSVLEEFKRYFDIGVFHDEQRSVLSKFTRAESEGAKYVVQEWHYLIQNGHLTSLPAQLIRTATKYLGYRMGRMHYRFPTSLKRRLSMHASYWSDMPIKG